MNGKVVLGIIAFAVLMIGGLVGLSMSGSFTPTGNAIKTGSNENRPFKEFAIESFTEIIDGKYYPQYSLKEISVNKGDLVRIKITVKSGMHDFKIDEFNVYADTKEPNKEYIVEFVADKEGSFEYYCTKPGHRQNGHFGTLKVLD